MSKITKVYMISRLAKDNVVEWDNNYSIKVDTVSRLIQLVDVHGANEIKVFMKDGNKTLIKRFFKLMEKTAYGFKEELGYTKDWPTKAPQPVAPMEHYATNYYVVSIRKEIKKLEEIKQQIPEWRLARMTTNEILDATDSLGIEI